MNNTKLEKIENNIYEMIAQGIPLNNENLSFYSINKDDIEELISKSIIIPIKEKTSQNNTSNQSKYIVSNTPKLYQYGVKLSSNKQYQKATRCFYKCYELDPNNREYSLRMLLVYIKEKQYQKAIYLMSHIETLESVKYQNENIIYLYLLNILTDSKEETTKKIQDLDPDTLMHNDKIKQIPKEEYNIRRAIYLNKFKYAFQLLIENMELQHNYSIKNKLLRELLKQTVTKEEIFKRNIIQLIKNEKYLDIIKEIDDQRKNRYLNSREMYIYLIIESIINIKNTRIIPKINITNTAYLYDAIKGNNFIKAKQLNEEYLFKTSKDVSNDPVNMLLEKINDLILEIKLEPIDDEKNNLEDTNKEIHNIEEKNNKELLFIEELAYYIKSKYISIDYAKKQLGIIPSQVLLIKLIYARDYFIEGLDELGNQLLKEVEKSKDRNIEVNKFLNEIRREKKFYKNRINNKIKILKQ